MREKSRMLIVTFVSTHDAIAMEKRCRQDGIPGRLIPVPRQISASCGLAYSVPWPEADKVKNYMENTGLRLEGSFDLEL